jgi:hypothetical protein
MSLDDDTTLAVTVLPRQDTHMSSYELRAIDAGSVQWIAQSSNDLRVMNRQPAPPAVISHTGSTVRSGTQRAG